MEEWLTVDPVFSNAPEKAGYWGQPRTIIQQILSGSISVIDEKAFVDPAKAKSLISQIMQQLNATKVNYEVKARILGLELAVRKIPITDSIALVKLTDEEVNDRQRYVESFSSLDLLHK